MADTPTEDAKRQNGSQNQGVNLGYIKTIPGILKIVEFVLLILAWALCAYAKGYNTSSRVGFFLFISIVSWLFVIALFIFNVVGLINKINLPIKSLLIGIAHGILALLLFIASALIADSVAAVQRAYSHPLLNLRCSVCDYFAAAAAFGFFSMAVLGIDGILHILNHVKGNRQ